MAIGNPLGEDQSETGARKVPVERPGDAAEALEDSVVVFRRNADPCIDHTDLGNGVINARHSASPGSLGAPIANSPTVREVCLSVSSMLFAGPSGL